MQFKFKSAAAAVPLATAVLFGAQSNDASTPSKFPLVSVVVDTVALLRAVPKTAKEVSVAGYYAARDGGGGFYALDAADTTTADDGGAVIVATDGGRWKLRHGLEIDVRQYGAKFDGTTDDSTAFNAALTYVRANALTLRLPPGTARAKNLRLNGGTRPWAVVGAGKLLTVIEHSDGDGTLMQNGAEEGAPGFKLSDFTLDCKYAEYNNAFASGGISVGHVSNMRVERVHVRNYKTYGILIYANLPGIYEDGRIIDCTTKGNNVDTGNGMLIANMANSALIRCGGEDAPGSPGYAVQLKNECPNSFIIDSYGKNCKAAIAFGNDVAPTPGIQHGYVIGCRSYGCDTAFGGLEIFDCSVHFTYVDMENFVGYPITCEGASSGNNYVIDTLVNLAAGRAVFRFQGTANGNKAHIGVAKNRNATGYIAEFAGTATNNHVTFDALVNPTNHANGFRGLVGFNTTTGNSITSPRLVPIFRVTIAADAITLRNDAPYQTVELANEAAAALDNLATISAGYLGQRITLRITSNSQKTDVKHGTGNIRLAHGTDISLSDTTQLITLEYVPGSTAWCEVTPKTTGPATASRTGTAYTALSSDAGLYMRFTNAAAKAVTFDATLVMGEYYVRNVGAGDLTLTAGAGVTLNPPAGGSLVLTQREFVTVKKVAAAEFDVI